MPMHLDAVATYILSMGLMVILLAIVYFFLMKWAKRGSR